MNNQLPVTKFLSTWLPFITDSWTKEQLQHLRKKNIAPYPQREPTEEQRTITEWHIGTAVPTWLESTKLLPEGHKLFQHCTARLENPEFYKTLLELLDHVNNTLVTRVNKLESTTPQRHSRILRLTAMQSLGISGEIPARSARTFPRFPRHLWHLITKSENTAYHAALLQLLAHCRSTQPPAEASTALLQPTITNLQQNAIQFLHRLLNPSKHQTQEGPQ